MSISSSMRELPHWTKQFEEEQIIIDYCPTTFNFIVPYLRFRYPSLRQIRFGRAPSLHDGNDLYEWVVSFIPASQMRIVPGLGPVYNKDGYEGELGGEIHCFSTLDFCLDDGEQPPEAIIPPLPPKGSYALQHRFNFACTGEYRLYLSDTARAVHRSWVAALKGDIGLENLYTCIHFGPLPVTLEGITSLLCKQASAGHTTRLESVMAPRLLPWSMVDFSSFARIASTSLTTLNICGTRFEREMRPAQTFAELPALIACIRTGLPHLSKLTFGMDDIADAEATCKGFLTPDSLCAGGTVKELKVMVGVWQDAEPIVSLFNVIRVLSAPCTSEAEINVDGALDTRLPKAQTAYLRYLRRQKPKRQFHLATVDFTLSLGITKLSQVLKLKYRKDGRPKLKKPKKAEKVKPDDWTTNLAIVRATAATFDQAALARSLASGRLNEISATVPAWERLALAERVLGVTIPLRAQPGWLGRCRDVGEVRDHIEVLKREEAEQEAENAEA